VSDSAGPLFLKAAQIYLDTVPSSLAQGRLSTTVNCSLMRIGTIEFSPLSRTLTTRTKERSIRTIFYLKTKVRMAIMLFSTLSCLENAWRTVFWDILVRILLLSIHATAYSFRSIVALGVNSSASYKIYNSNYLNSSSPDTGTIDSDSEEPLSMFELVIVSLNIACASVLSVASAMRYGVETAWATVALNIRRVF
jgi:hypothetical protein